jgi:hypothetical protein
MRQHVIHQSLVCKATTAHGIATARGQERELDDFCQLLPNLDALQAEMMACAQ